MSHLFSNNYFSCKWDIKDPINLILGNESFIKKYGRMPNFYDTDDIRIKTHLLHVYKILETKYENTREFDIILKYLDEYIKLENFPKNTELTFRNPIFIDKDNNYCAVGYLIMKTLGEDVCREIDKNFHFSYIHEIKSELLNDWMKKYKIELIDLQMIQPGYSPAEVTFFIFVYLLVFMVPLFIINNLIFSSMYKYYYDIKSLEINLLFYLSVVCLLSSIISGIIILIRKFQTLMVINLVLGFIFCSSLFLTVFFKFSYFYTLNKYFQISNCLIPMIYIIVSTIISLINSSNIKNRSKDFYYTENEVELNNEKEIK